MFDIGTLFLALLFIVVILILAGIATLLGAALLSIVVTIAITLFLLIVASVLGYLFRPSRQSPDASSTCAVTEQSL